MPCLPRETLKQYIIGGADEQIIDEIEKHLVECQSCEQTIIELERDPDTLVCKLREQRSADSQAESDSSQVAEVVKETVDALCRLPQATGGPDIPLTKLAQIGAYELIEPIGRGGMGLVMRARHRTLQKIVAIKLLPSRGLDRPELVGRFQREIRAAGKLNHPSIVNATDAGAEQGTHYLVMEYIDGLDLSQVARSSGPLSVADACELARQAALGLSYAHAQGIVHRDIKPSNLMLDLKGQLKILDFGLAQLSLWNEMACELTTVGQLMGTLDYMAPEQAERVGSVDYRADLYALGATLFRLLTGRPPLAATPHMTILEKIRLLGSQTAPSVSTFRDDCPSELAALIGQLLSRSPSDRPPSAAHVAEALQPFCQQHNLSALVARAKEVSARQTAQSLDMASETVWPGAASALMNLASEPSPRETLPGTTNSGRMLTWIAIALTLGGLLLAGVVMITLETAKGVLVIESDVADVRVQVKKNGQAIDDIQVQTGAQATRLWADKYEVTVESPSDAVSVDQGSIEVKRGEVVVIKVRRAATKENSMAAVPSQDVGKNDANKQSEKPAEVQSMPPLLDAIARLQRETEPHKINAFLRSIAAYQTDSPSDPQVNEEAARQLIAWAQSMIPTIDNPVSATEVAYFFVMALNNIPNKKQSTDQALANLVRTGPPELHRPLYSGERMEFDRHANLLRTMIAQLEGKLPISADAADAAAQQLIRVATISSNMTPEQANMQQAAAAALRDSKVIPATFWIRQATVPVPSLATVRSLAANSVLANLNASPEECLLAHLYINSEVPQAALDWVGPRLDLLQRNRDRMLMFYKNHDSGLRPIDVISSGYWNSPTRFTLPQIGLNEFDCLCDLIERRKLTQQYRDKLQSIKQQIDESPSVLQVPQSAAITDTSTSTGQPPSGKKAFDRYNIVDVDAWNDASQQRRILILHAARIECMFLGASELAQNDSAAPQPQPATQTGSNTQSPTGGDEKQSRQRDPVDEALHATVYNGQTLYKWLETARTDRSPETLGSALTAIDAMMIGQEKVVKAYIANELMTILAAQLDRVPESNSSSDNILQLDSLKEIPRGSRSASTSELCFVISRLQPPGPLVELLMKSASKDLEHQINTVRLLLNQALTREAFEYVLQNKLGTVADRAMARLWYLFLIEYCTRRPVDQLVEQREFERVLDWARSQSSLKTIDLISINLKFRGGRSQEFKQLTLLEYALSPLAKQLLLDESSSREAVAIAAGRLASTDDVSLYRDELKPVIQRRLLELAADPQRMLTPLSISGQWSYQDALVPQVRFPNLFSETLFHPMIAPLQERSGRVVDSEILGLMALTVRLQLVKACEAELTKVFRVIAPLAKPLWDGFYMQTDYRWPFRNEMLISLNAEQRTVEIRQAVATVIFMEFMKYVPGPESNVKRIRLVEMIDARDRSLRFKNDDTNQDGKLDVSEFGGLDEQYAAIYSHWDTDGDKQLTLAEIDKVWKE